MTEKKRLCVSKYCTKNILNIAHENEHLEYVKTHDIITKFWYIQDLIKLLRKYIQHCSKCLTCQIKRHKFYESLQFIDSSLVSFYIIIMNFVLTLSHTQIENKITKSKLITSSNTMFILIDKFFIRIFLIFDQLTLFANDWVNLLIKHLNIANWEYFIIIISDRDRKFLFDLWKSVFKFLKIHFLYFTIYHF